MMDVSSTRIWIVTLLLVLAGGCSDPNSGANGSALDADQPADTGLNADGGDPTDAAEPTDARVVLDSGQPTDAAEPADAGDGPDVSPRPDTADAVDSGSPSDGGDSSDAQPGLPWETHGQLQVTDNGHYLEYADGTPFLWLGDTAWGLVERLDRGGVDRYLDDRKQRRVNVIQTVVIWGKRDGLDPVFHRNPQNAYGHRPFEFAGDGVQPDPSSPKTVSGGSPTNPNDFWDHLEYIIDAAASRGLYVALLPQWGWRYTQAGHNDGSFATDVDGPDRVFDAALAKSYGKFIGQRYSDKDNIIWVLGGDANATQPVDQRMVYRRMAEGILKGVTGEDAAWDQPDPAWDEVLMTYHPRGGSDNSSAWFHSDPWLDFNGIETYIRRDDLYGEVNTDYQRSAPVKPTMVLEPNYECGISNRPAVVTPRQVRRQVYQTFFAGGAGHTYGRGICAGEDAQGSLWAFVEGWPNLLDSDGVDSLGVLEELFASFDWQSIVPAPAAIDSGEGDGETRKVAVRTSAGDRLLVYFPDNSDAQIRLDDLTADRATARWFDPRNGDEQMVGEVDTDQPRLFSPPDGWMDGVLVVDN